jgi:hypothetical protein
MIDKNGKFSAWRASQLVNADGLGSQMATQGGAMIVEWNGDFLGQNKPATGSHCNTICDKKMCDGPFIREWLTGITRGRISGSYVRGDISL